MLESMPRGWALRRQRAHVACTRHAPNLYQRRCFRSSPYFVHSPPFPTFRLHAAAAGKHSATHIPPTSYALIAKSTPMVLRSGYRIDSSLPAYDASLRLSLQEETPDSDVLLGDLASSALDSLLEVADAVIQSSHRHSRQTRSSKRTRSSLSKNAVGPIPGSKSPVKTPRAKWRCVIR